MKLSWLKYGFLSASAVIVCASFTSNSASAQCVQFDQGIQVSISGSGPARRSNNVDMRSEGSCTGNSVVTTGQQVHVGPGRAVQERNVRQIIRGNGNNRIGGGQTVQIRVNPTIDVYNAADRYRNLRRQ